MATSKSTKASTAPEVVADDATAAVSPAQEKADANVQRVEAEAPGTKDVGAGTDAGEQIGGTPAEGVAAPEGGTFPEATPNDLPEPAPTGASVEEPPPASNTPQPGPGSSDPQSVETDTYADAGGSQAGHLTEQPSEPVKDGELADSAAGAQHNPTQEQADQGTGGRLTEGYEANPDGESPRRAIAENTPATPPNVRVADGLAEAMSTTDAQTTSFASAGREAPYRG